MKPTPVGHQKNESCPKLIFRNCHCPIFMTLTCNDVPAVVPGRLDTATCDKVHQLSIAGCVQRL